MGAWRRGIACRGVGGTGERERGADVSMAYVGACEFFRGPECNLYGRCSGPHVGERDETRREIARVEAMEFNRNANPRWKEGRKNGNETPGTT